MDAMKDSAYQSDLANVIDISYHTINKISCEVFLFLTINLLLQF